MQCIHSFLYCFRQSFHIGFLKNRIMITWDTVRIDLPGHMIFPTQRIILFDAISLHFSKKDMDRKIIWVRFI